MHSHDQPERIRTCWAHLCDLWCKFCRCEQPSQGSTCLRLLQEAVREKLCRVMFGRVTFPFLKMFDVWIASMTAGCFCNAQLQGSEWRSRQRMPWVSSWRQAGRHFRDVKGAVLLWNLSVHYNCKAHQLHSVAVHSVAFAFRMHFSNLFTDSYWFKII